MYHISQCQVDLEKNTVKSPYLESIKSLTNKLDRISLVCCMLYDGEDLWENENILKMSQISLMRYSQCYFLPPMMQREKKSL